MAARSQVVRWEVRVGEPVTVGRVRLVEQSGALVVRLPFGGFVWHRPVAVRVEGDGENRRVAIRDVTRVAQLALFGLAALVAALATRNR
ncbi:MAG TPA: hypothetical protein VGM69_02875 [Chloroflexota bacterium]